MHRPPAEPASSATAATRTPGAWPGRRQGGRFRVNRLGNGSWSLNISAPAQQHKIALLRYYLPIGPAQEIGQQLALLAVARGRVRVGHQVGGALFDIAQRVGFVAGEKVQLLALRQVRRQKAAGGQRSI